MMWFIWNVQNWVRKHISGCQGPGVRQMREAANGVSGGGEEDVLELDSGMASQLCEYTQNHWTVQF